MYVVRRWSVRYSRQLNMAYQVLEVVLNKLHPLLALVGYERLEPYFQFIERQFKTLLFDCQMCGQCVLNSTGMACPMNCPKTIRNGPCGGVRPNGHCEVKPEMRCVWVEASRGAQQLRNGERIAHVQFAVDSRLRGRSSWIAVARDARRANEFDVVRSQS